MGNMSIKALAQGSLSIVGNDSGGLLGLSWGRALSNDSHGASGLDPLCLPWPDGPVQWTRQLC